MLHQKRDHAASAAIRQQQQILVALIFRINAQNRFGLRRKHLLRMFFRLREIRPEVAGERRISVLVQCRYTRRLCLLRALIEINGIRQQIIKMAPLREFPVIFSAEMRDIEMVVAIGIEAKLSDCRTIDTECAVAGPV